MQKKLIGFNETLLGKVEEYSQKNEITFTEAVRQLIEIGLGEQTDVEQGEPDAPDLASRVTDLEEKIKQFSWWDADDMQSRLGNAELEIKKIPDIEKKVNVLVGVSKKFKGHLNDREIHLQD